jgi:hypothetical protein
VYHLELRQFPHNFCRFNLTERELRGTILDAWARGEWIDLGERKWNPHQATLTVLEGPQLPVGELSMGRGWRTAKRQGRDVTEALLSGVRTAVPADSPSGKEPQGMMVEADVGVLEGAGRASQLAADSLGLHVLAALSDEPAPIALAWRLARARHPDRSAGECLVLAELAVRSLSRAGLIVVLTGVVAWGSPQPLKPGAAVARALLDLDGWGSEEAPATLSMRRA